MTTPAPPDLLTPVHATPVHAETTLEDGIAPEAQERLINWGDIVCDASPHVSVEAAPDGPNPLPYPE
jgi:hypothetical protein